MDPIVPRLKQLIREKRISHAYIAEKMGKHRAFITRKLGGDSMETRTLEAILEACEMSWQDLFCNQEEVSLKDELAELKNEINHIKAVLPEASRQKLESGDYD